MIRKITLENGVTLLTEDVSHVRSVAVGVWVNVGSRDEDISVSGISHFIEHLMFKGTEKRTAKQIAEALDAVGGQLNAFTTKEYTCYYAKVLDEHFDLALDVLTDMIFGSRFASPDIDREKNVIIEEIKMYEDAPDELVHDVFTSTLWQGHALGRPIIGQAEVIGGMTRDDIIAYYSKHYIPANMVISVAGNIDHDAVGEKIKRAFDKVRGTVVPRILTEPSPKREITCRSKDTEQVHICAGAPGLPLDHENIYVFQLVNTILGGGLSSRLFQEIREQRGLVYSVYSYHSSYHDAGLFCIYAGLSKQNLEPAMDLIIKEVRDIQKNGVTEVELRRAKDQLKGNLLLSLESVNTRMSRLGKSQLYLGKVVPPEDIVARVEKVSGNDIIKLANEMLRPELFSIASVGPWDDCKLLENAVGRASS
ncbi:peptidase [Desulfocucumis palustris]|uniref:Peptidase n=1 Tax=Desulfocucumis palustris TaxID=1898651 RepID=A0A2L2XCX9_9FIRM|nr:pitrilysin family protein [Desulfocucumis palustris]GBF34199.1 peptidase [Desulfocucumis palustris]